MLLYKMLCVGALLASLTVACSNITTPEPTAPPPPPTATQTLPTATATHAVTATPFINAATVLAGTRPPPTPITPTSTRTATTVRPPNAAVTAARGGTPEPTVLKNAKRIPDTHAGRTQCLTCHEFGNVGPPMPQFHKDDHYNDNTICLRCHQRNE